MDFKYTHQAMSIRDAYTHPKPFRKSFPVTFTDVTLPDAPPFFLEKFQSCKSSCLMSSVQGEKDAGMKIFSTIILRAWRQRRDDVHRLLEKVEELKKNTARSKNQIQVYNTLYRVEQKRNDELTCQLKQSLENINQSRASCERLRTSVVSLKADRAFLEQELEMKHKDIEALRTLLDQAKADLFRVLVEQRHMHVRLSKEQRLVQYLENQKNKLIDEICELGRENRTTEEKYRTELNKKEEELGLVKMNLKLLEGNYNDLKQKALKVKAFTANDARLKAEVQMLQLQVVKLNNELEQTLGNRLRLYWNSFLVYQKTALNMAHLFASYLLPATPPPKFAFTSKREYL